MSFCLSFQCPFWTKCEFIIMLRVLMPQVTLPTVEEVPWVRDPPQPPPWQFALYFKAISKLLQFPGGMQGCLFLSRIRPWACWEELTESKEMLPLKEASLCWATTPNFCQTQTLRREPLSPWSFTRAYVPQLPTLGWPSSHHSKCTSLWYDTPEVIYSCSRYYHNTNNDKCAI